MGLGGRLAFAFATLVAATALIIGTASYLTTGTQVAGEIDRFLESRADELIEGQRPTPADQPNRGDTPTSLVADPDSLVQLLNQNGTITSNTGQTLPVDLGEKAIANRREPAQLRTVSIDGTDYRMITKHISGGGAIQVARSLDESNELLALLRSRLFLVSGSLATVAAIAGWALARQTTKPIRLLASAVQEVAEHHDFEAAVNASSAVEGNDEVAQLTRGFNRMLEALHDSQEQQHRLVQDAAHELRTPLTSIQANIGWLSHANELDQATRTETLGSVRRELGELNHVITEIIELATGDHESPEFEPIDLAPLAKGVVARQRAVTGRSIELLAEPCTVLGSGEALERALTNLLSNADKYSPAGEPILVEVLANGVWVSDCGVGIPVAERSRVLDRFYRRDVDRSMPGSGLGLSIVASIIKAHSGTVRITDADSGGTKIGFTLPPQFILRSSV